MRHHGVRAAAQHALLGGGRASGAADLDWSRSRGNQAGRELRPTFETLKTVYFETIRWSSTARRLLNESLWLMTDDDDR